MRITRESRVVVTGAGGGLGRELSLELSRRGARVWVTDIDGAAASRTADECRTAGASDARSAACDVSRIDAFERLGQDIKSAWGGLDLLVNNAGVAIGGHFEDYTLEDWRWALDVNLMGVVHGCHVFFPMMKEAGRGAILNIASAAGLLNPPRMAAYNVTKAAVVSLSETLRAECSGGGIQVSVACPAFFKSGLFDTGRFKGEDTRETARLLFDRSRATAAQVARRCIRAVESGRFYVIPMLDARVLWWFKRAFPVVLLRIWTRLVPKPPAES